MVSGGGVTPTRSGTGRGSAAIKTGSHSLLNVVQSVLHALFTLSVNTTLTLVLSQVHYSTHNMVRKGHYDTFDINVP